jgi:hypothetical protein
MFLFRGCLNVNKVTTKRLTIHLRNSEWIRSIYYERPVGTFQHLEFPITSSWILTSLMHAWNIRNSWIHDFNFMNLRFIFMNSQFNFTNSQFQLYEFTTSWRWIHNFMNLKSWIRLVEIMKSWSWNREFLKLKSWIHEAGIVKLKCPIRSFVIYRTFQVASLFTYWMSLKHI